MMTLMVLSFMIVVYSCIIFDRERETSKDFDLDICIAIFKRGNASHYKA